MTVLKIRFSILIPVYNVEKYLPECIESVLNQTYQNFEIILVDDGSTDNSGKLCDEYEKKDSRIRVYHKVNGGQLHTREYAVKRASGDWYVFLDSDDSLQPNALETIYNKILQYDCDLVIYGWQRFCGEKILDDTATGRPDFIFSDKRSLYKTVFFDQQYNSLCRKAVKADLFTGQDYSRFYKIKYGEDLLQSIELLNNANKVLMIDQLLYNYRMNPQSMVHTIDYSKHRVDFTVRETILEFLEKSKTFTKEDFKEYRSCSLRFLAEEIWDISISTVDNKTKKRLFTEMSHSKYYRAFLENGEYYKKKIGKKYFCVQLLGKRRYYLLMTLCKLLFGLKKIYCFLKNR